MDGIPNTVKLYAFEDITEALQIANKKVNGDMRLKSTSFERGDDNPESDILEYSIWVEAEIDCPRIDEAFIITFEYVVHGDDVYVGGSIDSWADSLADRYNIFKKHGSGARYSTMNTIESAKSHKHHKRIVASEESDVDFHETFEDLSDTIDDMQEQLEEVDEDEIDIELDNNISNHFIAECDRCQGVFISALRESDQEIEKISGVCPLCQKRTDQYLKWIIKDVK